MQTDSLPKAPFAMCVYLATDPVWIIKELTYLVLKSVFCDNEIVFSSSWGFYGAWADKTGCFHLQNGNVMFKTWCLLSPTEFACLFKIDKIPQQKTSKLIKVVKKSTEIYIKSFVLQILQQHIWWQVVWTNQSNLLISIIIISITIYNNSPPWSSSMNGFGRKQTSRGLEGSLACNRSPLCYCWYSYQDWYFYWHCYWYF